MIHIKILFLLNLNKIMSQKLNFTELGKTEGGIQAVIIFRYTKTHIKYVSILVRNNHSKHLVKNQEQCWSWKARLRVGVTFTKQDFNCSTATCSSILNRIYPKYRKERLLDFKHMVLVVLQPGMLETNSYVNRTTAFVFAVFVTVLECATASCLKILIVRWNGPTVKLPCQLK